MYRLITIILVMLFGLGALNAQDKKKALAKEKSNNYVYEANTLVNDDDLIAAEMEYRKAISEAPSNVAGTYNLAHSYYKEGNFNEALYRSQEAAKNATSKEEKHKSYHSIGNILMQNEMCKEAVEAYKNALRSNPTDDETRYNLALAKECAKQQGGGGEDNKEDKDKDQDKKEDEKKDQEGDNKEDKKDEEGDKDKKQGEEKEDDKGKPKDEKKDQGEGDDKNKKQKPKPQQGQMSPQQIKNILEAMQNQEQKVQEKINAEKQKGAKVKTEKDW